MAMASKTCFKTVVLGFEVDWINTVQFSTHTGYKTIKGNVLENMQLEELVEGLSINKVDYYTHLITGYSRSPESLKHIAKIVKKLRERNPHLVYVCDPVMGDNGVMYVPSETLPVYKDIVVPLADIITPNQYEAELLTGITMKDMESALKVLEAIHNKGVKTVVISSSDLGNSNSMLALASTKNGPCYKMEIPKKDARYTGTGDLFAALFLAWSHKTGDDVKLTLEKSMATLQAIAVDTFEKARAIHPTGPLPPAVMELRLIQNKSVIERPNVTLQAVEVTKPH